MAGAIPPILKPFKLIKMNIDFLKDYDGVYYEIADANFGMSHSMYFSTEEEARRVIEEEYTSRSKNAGSNEYWRNRKQIVIKVEVKKTVLG